MFDDGSWVGYLVLLLPLASIAVPVVVLYFVYRFLRAYERRGASREATAELSDRVAALEDQIARLAVEQERLAEGQRFTNALLARAGASPSEVPASAP